MIGKSIFSRILKNIPLLVILMLLLPMISISQENFPVKLSPDQWHKQERALRYKPEGGDFVIVNGDRLFTRALYGTHTTFRVETGDRPEFALYMPGMGGNFKLGIQVGNESKWLTNAKTITARYSPGAMLYTIEDPLLQKTKLYIKILALASAEGFIIESMLDGVEKTVILHYAFGGASGKKFSRDGDMGPDPESNYYLKPEYCVNNDYKLGTGNFSLNYGDGLITASKQVSIQQLNGLFDPSSTLKLADASRLTSPIELHTSSASKTPVISGTLKIKSGTQNYFSVYNPSNQKEISYSDLPHLFSEAEDARLKLANRIVVNTPDPYINTIGGALGIAADAIWEAPSYLHGSIGWRTRLNGWRGPYVGDELGWHDRAKSHFEAYIPSQVTTPASGPIVADSAMHLARSQEKLGIGMFTEGYISRDPGGNLKAHHYDMNMVYIDELLRHYEWTGNLDFVKKTWPLLKRHLEWENRNFDVDGNGLYDAYAVIWASDALYYSGGDVTHSSAYNYYAFKKAAQIANLLGEDPLPYQKQAEKILKAINDILWMPKDGHYAEFRDALGNRALHPSAALWTIYHSIDSEVPDRFQAFQSLRYIDTKIPHIPVRAKGLKDEGYYTVSTTSWMPYQWSLNNVALAESMHTALANWQAGRIDEGYKLFKSEILASMYLGGSPGNFVQISHYDAARGEAYRDFADPIAMFSRALVEGLFGIVPNALDGTLTIRPGLPKNWNYASFSMPDISFDFKREKMNDHYTIIPKLPVKLGLKFQIVARGQVKNITVNGTAVQWKNLEEAVGSPIVQIEAPLSEKYKISIAWEGIPPALPGVENTYASNSKVNITTTGVSIIKVFDPEQVFTSITHTSDAINAITGNSPGEHTAFAKVTQGKLTWWMPLCFTISPELTLLKKEDAEINSNTFRIINNAVAPIRGTISVNDFQAVVAIPAGQSSAIITVPKSALVTGTNQVNFINEAGKNKVGTIVDWNATSISTKLELIDLTLLFNDKVTQIFKNKYLTPRPSATTLQLPWQGIGDWPKPLHEFDVNDSGLRKLAGEKGIITLPQGITFATPGNVSDKNIIYTSQWDNYPKDKKIPLSGKASHAWFLMAGSTNPMQSQLENGQIVISYTDGTTEILPLRNPETWWPIDQDYMSDGFAFSLKQPRPYRIHLQTGKIVSGEDSKKMYNGKFILGGAATVLDLPLDPTKVLKELTLKTLANDVVIGLMSVTLLRN